MSNISKKNVDLSMKKSFITSKPDLTIRIVSMRRGFGVSYEFKYYSGHVIFRDYSISYNVRPKFFY